MFSLTEEEERTSVIYSSLSDIFTNTWSYKPPVVSAIIIHFHSLSNTYELLPPAGLENYYETNKDEKLRPLNSFPTDKPELFNYFLLKDNLYHTVNVRSQTRLTV